MPPLPCNKALYPLAKELRKNAPEPELTLWNDYLRDYSLRFERQKVIGDYIVDFYCHGARLVIELNGTQHDGVAAKN